MWLFSKFKNKFKLDDNIDDDNIDGNDDWLDSVLEKYYNEKKKEEEFLFQNPENFKICRGEALQIAYMNENLKTDFYRRAKKERRNHLHTVLINILLIYLLKIIINIG